MQRRLYSHISPAVRAKPSTVAYEFHILEQRTHKYHNNEFSLSQIFISRGLSQIFIRERRLLRISTFLRYPNWPHQWALIPDPRTIKFIIQGECLMHITCTTCIIRAVSFSQTYMKVGQTFSYLSISRDLEISQSQINYLLTLNKYTIIIKHDISSSFEQTTMNNCVRFLALQS